MLKHFVVRLAMWGMFVPALIAGCSGEDATGDSVASDRALTDTMKGEVSVVESGSASSGSNVKADVAFEGRLWPAVWKPREQVYELDGKRRTSLPVQGAPADVDWGRWTVMHDGQNYRLYMFRRGSRDTIYQFAYNVQTEAFEYGYQSIPVLELNKVPSDADPSNFTVIRPANSPYFVFMGTRSGKPEAYSWQWQAGTPVYSLREGDGSVVFKGFPADTDWRRWDITTDSDTIRFYAFAGQSCDRLYQGAYDNNARHFRFGFESIPEVRVKGVDASCRSAKASLLHDGRKYRLFFMAGS